MPAAGTSVSAWAWAFSELNQLSPAKEEMIKTTFIIEIITFINSQTS